MHLKVSSAKWRPYCLGLNVLSVGACVCDYWLGSVNINPDIFLMLYFICENNVMLAFYEGINVTSAYVCTSADNILLMLSCYNGS